MIRMLFAGALLLIPHVAMAQTTPPTQGGSSGSVLGDVADIVFKEAEKRAIEEYYKRFPDRRPDGTTESEGTNDKDTADKDKGKGAKDKAKGRGNGLPPGLAKRDQLPPGLAKRGNRLPPGLMKSDLPANLEKELPDPPENAERVVVDDDVLLVQKGTDLILDVLEGVVRGNGSQ